MLKKILTIFFIAYLILVYGCKDSSHIIPIVYEGGTMGTYYKVTLIPNDHNGIFIFDSSLDQEKLHDLIETELKIINNIASTYILDSEISKFNNLSADNCIQASNDFLILAVESIRINKLTNGYYNPLVGPLVNLWGFGPEKNQHHILPKYDYIASLMDLINIDNIFVDQNNSLLCKRNDVYFDLSGLAKGSAVDRISNLLKSIGAKNFLVDIGGELYASGKNHNLDPWRLAVEKPIKDISPIQTIVSIMQGGIATSGDYRNFFTIDNKNYSHIINPKTGYPSDSSLASVTVIHSSTQTADALATGLMVMDFEEAKDFANKNELAVYLIKRNINNGTNVTNDLLSSWHSEEFKNFIDYH